MDERCSCGRRVTEIRAKGAEGQDLRGLGWKGPQGSSHSLQGTAEPHRAGGALPSQLTPFSASPFQGRGLSPSN